MEADFFSIFGWPIGTQMSAVERELPFIKQYTKSAVIDAGPGKKNAFIRRERSQCMY